MFIFDFLIWLWEYMFFSNSVAAVVPATTLLNNDLWILDYDFVESVSKYQLLDNISPVLIYDMERYIDQNFINSHPFFRSNYKNLDYGSYLRAYILEFGNFHDLNEYEAHLIFYLSTLKKIYIYNMEFINYDDIDFYIMKWGMKNVIYVDHEYYLKTILDDPDFVKCFSFNPTILVK